MILGQNFSAFLVEKKTHFCLSICFNNGFYFFIFDVSTFNSKYVFCGKFCPLLDSNYGSLLSHPSVNHLFTFVEQRVNRDLCFWLIVTSITPYSINRAKG